MQQIYANYTASITELKKSPSKLLELAGNEPIAILNHNKPSAYMISSDMYEKMIEIIDDIALVQEVKNRVNYSEDELIEVDIDELAKIKRDLKIGKRDKFYNLFQNTIQTKAE
jgi:antitoxin StbD